MSGAKHWEQDKEATVYVGNLDERVNDSLVWELMLQAGRIVNVHLPKDRVTQTHQGYGFVEFISEEDADYAAKVMNQVRLYGKPIRVNKASADKQKTVEIGAELFVGNLDPMVDERMLFETFGRFGGLSSPPKIARDPQTSLSKGYAFLSYTTFEAADDAIYNMNGQYIMNKEISVQYAYKKDGKGERHGDEAERKLAAQARRHNVEIPTQGMPPPPALPSTPAMPVAPPVQQPVPHAAAMMNGVGLPGQVPGRGPGTPTAPTPYAPPQQMPPPGGYSVPQQAAPPAPTPPPQRLPPPQNNPLPPAPSGLPARPPPSVAGYGGPAQFAPGGFTPQPGGAPPPPGFNPNAQPGFAPPPGFGQGRR